MDALMFGTTRRRRGAFTLIELLVVVVIIGILAGIAVVSYRGIVERSELESQLARDREVAGVVSAVLAFDDGTSAEDAFIEVVAGMSAGAPGTFAAGGFSIPDQSPSTGPLDYSWAYDAGGPAAADDAFVFAARLDDTRATSCFVMVNVTRFGCIGFDDLVAAAEFSAAEFSVAGIVAGNTPPPTTQAPDTAPGAPTGVSAVLADSVVTVTWVAPASNGGQPVTGYNVTATAAGYETVVASTSGSTSAQIGPLVALVPYMVTVTATNTVGVSLPGSVSFVPAATPGQVEGVVASPADGSVSVVWSSVIDDEAAPLSGYRVFLDGFLVGLIPAGETTWSSGALDNGTTYAVQVASFGPAGQATASASVVFVPRTVPGAVSDVSGVAGNASVSVSFVVPTDDGGAPVTGYSVVAEPGALGASGTESPIVVSGLTNGVSYTFTVSASNVAGSGSSSAPSAALVPAGLPGQVSGVTALPGNAQVLVSWSGVDSTLAAPLVGYRVFRDGVLAATVASATTTVTLDELTNGESYAVTVAAFGPAGESAMSAAVAVVPATVPGAPSAVSATSGANAMSTVTWASPGTDGGAVVSGYTVQYATTPGFVSPTTVTVSGVTTSVVVSSLTNGSGYLFRVAAINLSGTGTWSAASTVAYPFVLPTAPGSLTGVSGASAINLSWLPAAASPAVTDYVVEFRPSTGGAWVVFADGVSTTPSASVSGLAVNFSATLRVRASSVHGVGPYSAEVTVVQGGAPSAPTVTSVAGGDRQLTAFYSQGASNGSAVTGVIAQSAPVGGGWTQWPSTAPGSNMIMSGVAFDQSHQVRVATVNAFGQSAWSNVLSATPYRSTLQPGEHLNIGQSLWIESRSYQLLLQSDGNTVIYGPSGARWASSWEPGWGPVGLVVMDTSGQLIFYRPDWSLAFVSSWVTTPVAGSSAFLDASGTFRLVIPNGTTTWSR